MKIPSFNKKPATRDLPPDYTPVTQDQNQHPAERLRSFFSRSRPPAQVVVSPTYTLQSPAAGESTNEAQNNRSLPPPYAAGGEVAHVDESAYTELQRFEMAKRITKEEGPFICEMMLIAISGALKGKSQHLSRDELTEALMGGLQEAGYFDDICRISARDESAATLLHRTSLLGTPFEKTQQRTNRLMIEGLFSNAPRLTSTQKKRLPASREICCALNSSASVGQEHIDKMVPYLASNLSQQDEQDMLEYVRSPEGKRMLEESHKGSAERTALMKTQAVVNVVGRRIVPMMMEAMFQDRF